MIVEIRVTQAHIELGARDDSCGCPVALAVAGAVGSAVTVRAFADHVYLDGRKCLPADGSLRRFVEAFDAAQAVEPFTLPLDVPPERENRFAALAGAA